MIDLHMHTNYSDGTDSVIDLLKKAQKKQLEIISITDHNNCKAYDELEKIDIKKYYTGAIIKGVELTTKISGVSIELLGYDVDTKIINKEAKKMYETSTKGKSENEFNRLKRICEDLGVKFKNNLTMEYDKEKYKYSSVYIHEEIKKCPENKKFFISELGWEDPMEFYRKEISNPESNFYIDVTKGVPTVEEVVNLIKKAKGLVFVPHIYQYSKTIQEEVKKLKDNYEIAGYECYYSKFSKEQTQEIIEFCETNNLYKSGGSDYHGKTKPNIEMGTGRNNNLNINFDIAKPWINKLVRIIK